MRGGRGAGRREAEWERNTAGWYSGNECGDAEYREGAAEAVGARRLSRRKRRTLMRDGRGVGRCEAEWERNTAGWHSRNGCGDAEHREGAAEDVGARRLSRRKRRTLMRGGGGAGRWAAEWERNTAGRHSRNGCGGAECQEGAAEAAGEDHSEVGALKRVPAEVGGGRYGRRGGLEGFFWRCGMYGGD